MDVINLISKTEGLPDGDPGDEVTGTEHFVDGPRLDEYVTELYERTLEGRDVMTVGEMIGGISADEAAEYVGEDGLSMIIHFEHVHVDVGPGGKWDVVDLDLAELKTVVTDWQETLAEEGWNCLYLSNHDQPRAVSRFCDDGEYRRESAKMLATFLFTLQGTPFVFQGQEIGMTNADWDRQEIRDVEAENHVDIALDEWADSYEDVRPQIEARSRDNARTPMQWSADENAGFSEGDPWIKVNERHDEINVEAAREDADSIWHFYRELIDLREDRDIFVYGDYELLLPDHSEVFAYRRTLGDEELLVVCNFFEGEPELDVATFVDEPEAELLIGNYDLDAGDLTEPIRLAPYEARVYDLS